MEKRFSEAAVVEIIVKLYFYDKQKHKYAFVVLIIIKSNLNVSFFKIWAMYFIKVDRI